jgi:hypothetical protein
MVAPAGTAVIRRKIPAYQQHEAALESINQDPLLKSLEGDPRWKASLLKMKLPE